MSDDIDNGGKTGYYDLPKPSLKELVMAIEMFCEQEEMSSTELAHEILGMFPDTLNDLIEHKNMKPWQHEVMKAVYAIDDRAKKNGGSEIREINKIIYYANRGKNLASK